MKVKKALSIALNVIIWLFVAFAVVMTTLALAAQSNADGVPAIGGKCFLTVSSDSMSPTFKEGDLLICDMLTDSEKSELEVGDVISFYSDLDGNGVNEINSHRIVRVNYSENGEVQSYTTKGDNTVTNAVEDGTPVRWQYVICRWGSEGSDGAKIGGIGSAISFLQQPKAFLVVIVLPLILFFLYQLYVFIKAFMGIKNSGKRQITAADEELIRQRAVEEYIRLQAEKEKEAAKGPSGEAEDKKEEVKEAESPDDSVSDGNSDNGKSE